MNDEEALVYIKRLINMGYLEIGHKPVDNYLFEITFVGTDKARELVKLFPND